MVRHTMSAPASWSSTKPMPHSSRDTQPWMPAQIICEVMAGSPSDSTPARMARCTAATSPSKARAAVSLAASLGSNPRTARRNITW